jgi:hypothetical protein
MIEYPSDYHFRLRFMLALRPEVLEYIIKTHSVSAELSTLTQIRSACEDYERSNEYGKQLAATQARLGGSKAPGTHQSSLAQLMHADIPGHNSLPRELKRVLTTINQLLQLLGRMERDTRRLPLLARRPSQIRKPNQPHGMDRETRLLRSLVSSVEDRTTPRTAHWRTGRQPEGMPSE